MHRASSCHTLLTSTPPSGYCCCAGFVKARGYSARLGADSLQVVPISQAQARQRSGRAGTQTLKLATHAMLPRPWNNHVCVVEPSTETVSSRGVDDAHMFSPCPVNHMCTHSVLCKWHCCDFSSNVAVHPQRLCVGRETPGKAYRPYTSFLPQS